ncbi:hypothetical protein NIIDNTM18_09100 [Mycolicibacterium litorale]|uniref:DUF2293 domain-containing protein n=1 Tax=Mycolicibacterium litorale TaxID=758802 RepID=A0A6S6P0G3_9MYCO|nr:DUF2293 domain-containing protein [Mycolicibacterium litorale]BCI51632.1 hypothetical protein NIIDNTM18_09100 [Mycolicibacterium litorale]
MANVRTGVARVAETVLTERGAVRPVDILVGLGWIASPTTERRIQVDGAKIVEVAEALRHWAIERGLEERDGDYGDVTFTSDGDPNVERAYRTHWAPAGHVEPEKPRPRPKKLTVLAADHAWECALCGEDGDFFLEGKSGGVCLDCADLGHLEFLPSGDAALTGRARKASRLSAVVVMWNLRRNRYERQGILAEPAAIEQAARECLSDADVRARRRARDTTRRAVEDQRFQGEFAAAIREQFPGCPPERAEAIALHRPRQWPGRQECHGTEAGSRRGPPRGGRVRPPCRHRL